jgi:hypothetical protein
VALNTITLCNKLKSSDTKVLIKAYIEEEHSIDWQTKLENIKKKKWQQNRMTKYKQWETQTTRGTKYSANIP